MALLLAFNGYLTIAGLVVSCVGSLVQLFDPSIGAPMEHAGDLGIILGATRKGVKQFKGI